MLNFKVEEVNDGWQLTIAELGSRNREGQRPLLWRARHRVSTKAEIEAIARLYWGYYGDSLKTG